MNRDLDAALGLAFGALVTAIRKNGISEDELRHWLEISLGSYTVAQELRDDRTA